MRPKRYSEMHHSPNTAPFRRAKRMMTAAGLVLALGAILGGCSGTTHVRGYIADPDIVEALQPGVDNRDSVIASMGRPSVVSAFDDNTWYYISKIDDQWAFFQPKIKKQRILALNFNKLGAMEGIKTYTKADARHVEPVGDKTPTRGKELNFWQQIFSNIGRFSGAPGGAQSPGR